MENDVEERAKEVALFRFGVIADLVHLPKGSGSGLYDRLREKAKVSYAIPFSTRQQLAQETIRSWLNQYRKGGLESLYPKERSDAGKARRLPREVVDLICCIKEEQCDLTVKEVIEEAKQQVTNDYERRIAALEGKQEQMIQLFSQLANSPKTLELIMGDKRVIEAGRDYFEDVENSDVEIGNSENKDE